MAGARPTGSITCWAFSRLTTGRRDRGELAARPRAGGPGAGARARRLQVADAHDLEPRTRSGRQAESPAARPIRALSSHRSSAVGRARGSSMRISIAHAATWRTASRNASSTCMPIALPRQRCEPTSCACGSLDGLRSGVSLAPDRAAAHVLQPGPCDTIRLKLLKIGALVRSASAAQVCDGLRLSNRSAMGSCSHSSQR